jgi:hypothetical protein
MAVSKDRVAVACWGGLVKILSVEDGKVLASQSYDTDIAALAWWGEKLLVGLADGRMLRVAVP